VGDPEAGALFIRRYQRRVFGLARSIVDERALAGGTADAGGEVEMELDDYYLGPTFLRATPGATVHLELENEGDDTHTFTIDSLDIDQEVAAGESGRWT
jgi:hypothetical protein